MDSGDFLSGKSSIWFTPTQYSRRAEPACRLHLQKKYSGIRYGGLQEKQTVITLVISTCFYVQKEIFLAIKSSKLCLPKLYSYWILLGEQANKSNGRRHYM